MLDLQDDVEINKKILFILFEIHIARKLAKVGLARNLIGLVRNRMS